MIIQNSSDIKTDLFYDKNGEISPIDVRYEKHTINPNGLVQLQRLPSIHTVFDITRKDGINVVRYTKADVIIVQTDFIVDDGNGILTFHTSQKGKEIEASYTNSIGRLAISAERIFTSTDNKGNVVETVQNIIDNGNEALELLDVLGGASKVIQQTQANIDSIKGLSESIIEGEVVKVELDESRDLAGITNITLGSTINNASNKIQEMDQWINAHGDIVNLDNRVDVTEVKLNTVGSQLEQIIKNNPTSTKFIAHRGVSSVRPENSLPAIMLAKNYGYFGVEIDVCATADGEWILMHDSSLDRTTNGSGYISQLTLNQIRNSHIDSGSNIALYPNLKIPVFKDVLSELKKTNLFPVVEIKEAAGLVNISKLVEIIKNNGMEDYCVIISFNIDYIKEVRKYSKKIHVQFLSYEVNEGIVQDVLKLGNSGLDLQYGVVTGNLVSECHKKGLSFGCWTVDDKEVARLMVSYGVDFITSNKLVEEV